ncbi:MAG: thymidine phosphorylase [Polyangiaceae bacterium]|nr:thymidine phosphorylase [Polyangiaceae bacterium]
MTTRCGANPIEFIAKKRDGGRLGATEIQDFVTGFMEGRVTDYQMSAWLMAALLVGLDDAETVALTQAMLHSGKVLRFSSLRLPKVDKHSTGGVGDKISICLAPLVAACGVAVPMIAGRGLGHTGGTLDKLEAIPGYDTRLEARRFQAVVRDVGVSIIGQTAELAPADRRIYALRDVTGTVESIPLIVASILSKKLAAGLDGLVLDVKVGRGAFMKDLVAARLLARTLVRVGRAAGRRVVALLTDMSVPTGLTIGNALETREAIEVLGGGGPPDTVELTLALGAEMLIIAGVDARRGDARRRLEQARRSGAGLERFARMVAAHGGDPRVVEDPARLPRAPERVPVPAPVSGTVAAIDPRELALVALALGAGRTRADQAIDPRVGIELSARRGTRVTRGEPLAWLHVARRDQANPHLSRVSAAFAVARRVADVSPLVIGRVTR